MRDREELNQIILLKDKEVESQSSELQSVINKFIGNRLFVIFVSQNIYQAIGSIGPFLLLRTKYFRLFCKDYNIELTNMHLFDYLQLFNDVILFINISIYRKIRKQYDPKKEI